MIENNLILRRIFIKYIINCKKILLRDLRKKVSIIFFALEDTYRIKKNEENSHRTYVF